ncbi:hypothetical protein BH23CHL2_BH23CHL2_02740 [soil metagenome]
MTWAVTLDFHNTIAHCDEWFNLEVYDLVPAYLNWRHRTLGLSPEPGHIDRGKRRYRELRQRVMDTGLELDAAESLELVLQTLDVDASPDDVARALIEIFRPTVDSARPIPGVVESVKRLHAAGVRLAVVSSAAYHPFLEWTLEGFGIRQHFEVILTSASTGHYKSTPKIYEAALNILDILASACIHIGDSERFDVVPARELGINTVLFANGADVDTITTADLRVSTLVDLPSRLRDTFGMNIDF